MTTPSPVVTAPTDTAASHRWPLRAAAHVLGAGLLTTALIALPQAPSDLDRHQLPKETVMHLAVWLAVALARPARPAGLSRATAWFSGLLVIWAMVASLFATNPWLAFRATALTTSGVAALLTARHVAAAGMGTALLTWAGVSAVIASCTGLAQAYGFDSIFFAATRAPGGTFGNRNFLAHFATIALPVMVTLAVMARRTFVTLLAGLAAVAPVMMIVLSRSRAAWLGGLTVGAVFVAAMLLHRRRGGVIPASRLAALGVAVALAVTLALVLPNTLEWRASSPYAETFSDLANHREGSGRGRILQYQNTAELALRNPLVGVGPGNWPLHYGDVAPRDDPSWSRGDVIPLNPWPSSDWMAIASERGLPGMVFVVALGLAILWRGVRGLRAGDERAFAGAGVIAVLCAVAIQGSFDAVMLLPAPLLLAAVSVGALLDRADGQHGGRAEDFARPTPIWWVLILIILGAGAFRSAQQTIAYVIAGNGRPIARLVWAARIDPWSYPVRIALANREPCRSARDDAAAVLRLAPTWTAARIAARRCGVR